MEVSLTEKGKEALQKGILSNSEKAVASILEEKSYSSFYLKKRSRLRNFPSLLRRMEKKSLVEVERELKRLERKRAAQRAVRETQLEFGFFATENLQKAVEAIEKKIEERIFSPFFLFGSRQSREEVYFYLLKRILARGERVLFLVPEISLGRALIEKFKKTLGERVAILHSELPERQRESEWQKIRNKEADVVVGPRSALFSPLDNLGLIVVDEEHDDSYYQQESPSYDARGGAWLRAKEEKVALVYGSASPSVEGFYRAKKLGYLIPLEEEIKKRRVILVKERGGREVVSFQLLEAIGKRLERGEQALVFLNRRGYASFLFCSRCSYIPKCGRCDIALTYHKREEKLVCHYCHYSIPKMEVCPVCRSRIIGKRGKGIERVEEELKKNFPQARITCFDTDVIKSKKEKEKILHSFRKGKIDILIGTELLAHQVDLPSVSLIGILNPEAMLALSDFRAGQRTFQALTRMKGFLEEDSLSEIIIQTALPRHFSILQAARNDYISFYNQEIKFRLLMNYPPFSHMAEVLLMGENLRSLAQKAREFSAEVKSFGRDIEILGPALAPISKVRGLSRVQLVLKSRKKERLDAFLRESLKKIRLRKSVIILG